MFFFVIKEGAMPWLNSKGGDISTCPVVETRRLGLPRSDPNLNPNPESNRVK